MAVINLDKLDMDKLTREVIKDLIANGDTRPADQIHDILDALVRRLRTLEGDNGLENHSFGGSRNSHGQPIGLDRRHRG